MTPSQIIPGIKIDKLTVLNEILKIDGSNHLRRYWQCVCQCGNTIIKRGDTLCGRQHQSCGCDTALIQASNTKRLKWQGVGELSRTFFTSCKRSANIRKIEFNITMEDMWSQFEKQNRLCALSGMPIKLGGSLDIRNKTHSASLDRIDSNIGYNKTNIQWVHKTINLMKNVLSQQEFIDWCSKVYIKTNEFKT